MSHYYVYELWNTIKNQPFYVGISKRNIRPQEHISEALTEGKEYKKGANPHKIYTIRAVVEKGHAIDIKIILENVDKKTAIECEIELIAQYGRRDIKTGILVNMTDGGEGMGRHLISEESRKKRRDRLIGKSYEEIFGEKKAQIIKQKIAKSRQGLKTGKPAWNTGKTKDTDESVKKISESLSGRPSPLKGVTMTDINPNYKNSFKGKTHNEKSKMKMAEKRRLCVGKQWYYDITDNTKYLLYPDNPDIINKNLVLGRDWKAIQSDIDSGMSRKDIMKKHNINKNILYSGKRDGKLFGL